MNNFNFCSPTESGVTVNPIYKDITEENFNG